MKTAIAIIASLMIGVPAFASVDLYVNADGGSDSTPWYIGSPCTADHPCATPQYAINQVSKSVDDNVTVHIAAGTYYVPTYSDGGLINPSAVSTLEINGFSIDTGRNADAGLTILCDQNQALEPTIATGFTAGTATALPVLTVAGATWTVDQFAGDEGIVTQGTGAGTKFVIVHNTATGLSFIGGSTYASGTVFHIVEPGAVISDATSQDPATSATGIQYVVNIIGSRGVIKDGFDNRFLNVDGCGILAHSADVSGVTIQGSYAVGVQNSQIVTNAGSNFNGVYVMNSFSARLTNNYIKNFYAGMELDGAMNRNAFTGIDKSAIIGAHDGLQLYLGTHINTDGLYFETTGNSFYLATQSYVFDFGSYFNLTSGHVIDIEDGTSSMTTLSAKAFGTSSGFAEVESGGKLNFNSSTATTAANFVSLDHGSTWITKASIEAAAHKTVVGTTGALVFENGF